MRFCSAVFFLLLFISLASSDVLAEQPLSFNRDIRPILSASCFQCHGPDESHREAELRMDTAEGVAKAFGEMDLKKNLAWERITSDDPFVQMPPPEAHVNLTAKDRDTLRRWIEAGASYQGHWAFLKPVKPDVPTVSNSDWVANPIDAFVFDRLQREGLKPSKPAAREALLRRVTFDLTGLPPTLENLDAFLADTSPNAYERAVDRLLASEHFGERMAVMWLDAARYGDTSVFHADGPRDMWAWRDWVIRSYNDNKPFDEFSTEQLAGDLLPQPTVNQLVATAFNRNNGTSDEGGAIAEELRVEYAVDRVKTTSMVWMGLTMECAQCHNHKFDPISQEEYYQFYAYFNQSADPGMQTRRGNQKPIVEVPDVELLANQDKIKAKLAETKNRLSARRAAIESEFREWVATQQTDASDRPDPPGDLLAHFPLDEGTGEHTKDLVNPERTGTVRGKVTWTESKNGGAFKFDRSNQIDLGDLGDFDSTDSFSYGAWIKPDAKHSGAPLARMNDANNFRGYDLYLTGNAVAVHIIDQWPGNAIKVNTKATLKRDAWQHVFVTYDGSRKASGIKIYFDGKEQPWTIEVDNLTGSIRAKTPFKIGRRSNSSPFGGEVDDVRIYDRALTPTEVGTLAGTDPLAELLAALKSGEEVALDRLRDHYLAHHDAEHRSLKEQRGRLEAELKATEKPLTTVMVMRNLDKPRMTYVLDRGDYNSPLKDRAVEPGVPSALPPLPESAPKNRLTMANWLFDSEHPLTARVAVNRYWAMLFGTGIVKTVEDFGAQGEWPSHPDLLDWLAVDFAENGWDIKRTIKQIVMSNTYRQSSEVDAERMEADPENRLLSRGPRFRLQGEFIRDNALAVSGLLVTSVGGPSVKPYQPPGLWNEVSLSAGVRFRPDKGEKLYRRSLYTYWRRSAPPPSMSLFDAPARDKCVLRRSRTNTPMQALVTLNDVQFVEAARHLARRGIKDGGDTPADQITHAFRLATATRPSAETLRVLAETYERELGIFRSESERAKALLAIGDSPRDESIDADSHAAMTIVASMILNLDQTLTRN